MKQLVILALLSISLNTFSQEEKEKFSIDKGAFLIEGSFNINSTNTQNYGDNERESDAFGFGFYPKIGYAVNNNFILGIGLGYGYNKSDAEDFLSVFDSKSNTYTITPYAQKLFPISKSFALKLSGEFTYGLSKHNTKREDQSFNTESKQILIGVRPGINYTLSHKIMLHANIGYLGYEHQEFEVNNEEDQKRESFGLNLSTSDLTFGMTFIL
jgi:hypothetical protein